MDQSKTYKTWPGFHIVFLAGGGGRCCVYLATPFFSTHTTLLHISEYFTYFTLISDLQTYTYCH